MKLSKTSTYFVSIVTLCYCCSQLFLQLERIFGKVVAGREMIQCDTEPASLSTVHHFP